MFSNDIWIFVEYNDHDVETVVFEMLNEARKLMERLNGHICLCLMGGDAGKYIPYLQGYGAHKLYLLSHYALSKYSLDAYSFAFQKLIEIYKPLIIFFGATPYGSELAARIAASLNLACITEVKRITIEEEKLVITKSCYDEKAYRNFRFQPESTVVLSVLPGDMECEKTAASNEMDIIKGNIEFDTCHIRTRNMKILKGDPKKIRLEEADQIISGGNGIGKSMHLLEELADLLGASIGGTRPLVDENVIPFERQIGITGKLVNPRFIMNCGISGSREYTAGMENPKLSIAINTDEKAMIFKTADIGIHGNVNEIIPTLINALKKRNIRESNKE